MFEFICVQNRFIAYYNYIISLKLLSENIYQTGDSGTTSLFGGKRVRKDDLRIDTYGTVDELNSHIGLLLSSIEDESVSNYLLHLQSRLFTLGSNLASDPEKEMIVPDITSHDIEQMEANIDTMDAVLSPLTNFIMPSGSQAIAQTHVCRTVCRRAERLMVALSAVSQVDALLITFVNRLSDYFFVLARYIGHMQGVSEIAWQPNKK